jgi:hypothetical protein
MDSGVYSAVLVTIQSGLLGGAECQGRRRELMGGNNERRGLLKESLATMVAVTQEGHTCW